MNASSNSAARAENAGISGIVSLLFQRFARIRPSRSVTWGLTGAIVLGALLTVPLLARAQICALPGSDPSSSVSGVVNTYYSGGGSLSAGATSLALGARDARGSATPIAVGDLVLIMQMQDGALNSSNNSNYGAGNGTGQGTTSMGNAGHYEFVRADSVSGGSVTFSPALTYSYVQSAASTTSGQRRYQIIRVPQYADVSVSGVTAPGWDGTSGGVVSIDASGTLTLGGGSVEGQSNRAIFVAGRGFRGAAGVGASTNGNDAEWRSTANANGGKGEGIAGTPRMMSSKSNGFGIAVGAGTLASIDTGAQGYPDGDYARGAPGNAGGGGTEGTAAPGSNQRNAGGGGGGSYAAGGLGGRPWNAPLNDTGGRGGASYAGSLGFDRVLMGGGGGAGGTNNSTSDSATYENNGIGCSAGALCSSGASGGGVVILRARRIVGGGVIDVRGAHGYNVGNDAAGGGGAGGNVILQTTAGGNATIAASGGDGGNAWAGNTGGSANRHGPGGGGGGGFVAYSPGTFSVSATLTGGTPGRTSNGSTDTYGSSGNNGGLSGFQAPNVPGVSPGADCFPDLRVAKSNGVGSLNNGQATTYALTVSNQGGGPSTGVTTVVDVLPAGITVTDGAVALGGAQGALWACNAATNTLTCTTATVLAAGAASVFDFTAQVATVANGSSVTNRARVGGGGDLNKAVPDAAATAQCTGNDTPAGCAIDVDSVNAPLLSLVKTDGTDTVVAGATTPYQLIVSNTGAAPSIGQIRVVDVLPTGMSYTGASPFASGGFDCVYSAGTLSFVCDSSAAIAAGTSVAITLPATIAASTASALTNRAQVGGGGDPGKPTLPTVATVADCPAPTSPDTTNSNGSTGCAADTDAVTKVSLSLEKDDGQPFMPVNGQTTYQFRVRNTGNASSIGAIQFRDTLPTPMNWPAALAVAGPHAADWACTRVSAVVVSCVSSTVVAAGGVSNFSIVANVGAAAAGTQYLNRARVGGGGDANLPAALADGDVAVCTGNNTPAGCAVDLNTAQNAAQVRLSKTHANPQAKQPGDTVAFSLVVANSGGSATGTAEIRVVDVLPAGIDYSGPSSFSVDGFSCTHASGTLTCNRSTSLAAGATATLAFSATVSASASNGILTNRAQVAGGSDPQLGASNTIDAGTAAQCSGGGSPFLGCAVDPVPVVLDAALSISKTNHATTVRRGDTTLYELTISNAGPAAAHGAVLRDPAIPGLTCTTATCSPAGGAACPAVTGAALATAMQSGVAIPALPANGSVTFSLTCTVN
jgi:uncharacterized repeat protein (TIGR01451 family)